METEHMMRTHMNLDDRLAEALCEFQCLLIDIPSHARSALALMLRGTERQLFEKYGVHKFDWQSDRLRWAIKRWSAADWVTETLAFEVFVYLDYIYNLLRECLRHSHERYAGAFALLSSILTAHEPD